MSTSIKHILSVLTLSFWMLSVPTLASDHVDSPATGIDSFADLLDLYAFVAPLCGPGTGTACEGDPDELVLALTIKPFATGADQFPDTVVYHFYLENDSGDTSQIDCSFSQEQVVTCEGPGGRSVQARVGEIGANGDLRVFAGLRDDPAFFNLEAFANMQVDGLAAFQPPGTDFFAGSNVLAIVLGIKIDAIPASVGPDTNIQKIWAASERLGGDGLNGAISGSWYNPVQDGQGWLVEVVRMPNGNDKFVVYFYGYEFGEQVWLVGSSRFEGNSVSVDMVRTSGAEWGNAFNKGDVVRDVIGSMEFDFLSCNTANVSFTPGDTGLTAFSTSMQRLTNISSLQCSLLTSGQIDRVGRPLISKFLISEPMRDAYNAAADLAEWDTLFNAEVLAGIETLDLADGIAGNLLGGDSQILATMFVDDRLQIDLSQPICTEYATIEMYDLFGVAIDNCGGRAPFYDAVDETLGIVVSGFAPEISDYVHSNDRAFPSDFPFLAVPHGDYALHGDILTKIQGLEGIVVNEIQSPDPGQRLFQIDMEQPVDHSDPGGQKFTQRLYLHHVGESQPMVFAPNGYDTLENDVLGGELPSMLQANLLSSSHRYWPGSLPEPTDYQHLTITQAAADHHKIVSAFKRIYQGAWMSAGISKSGMTVIYHKRFYPNDVQATVAISAPFKFTTADERFPQYLSTIGTDLARQRIRNFQRLALQRRTALVPMFEAWFPQNGFVLAHDPDESFENTVISFQPEFWEKYTIDQVDLIPGSEATNSQILDLLNQVESFVGKSEYAFKWATPYFYQAYTEEGLEANSTDHLADLLETNQIDIMALFQRIHGITPVYDPSVMNDIYDWAVNSGDNMIYIYGGNDPWTAGAVNLTGATNAIKVTNPGDNHSVFINELPSADKELVISALEQWLGVDIH